MFSTERPGDLLAVLVAFGLVAYVISNITVRSMEMFSTVALT